MKNDSMVMGIVPVPGGGGAATFHPLVERAIKTAVRVPLATPRALLLRHLQPSRFRIKRRRANTLASPTKRIQSQA